MRFRRDAIGGLPQMPPLRGLGCFGRGAFYRDAAPTALHLWLGGGFYKDVAPNGASFVVGRRGLQRCRAYGARGVVQNDSRRTKMPRLRRFICGWATGSTEMPRLRRSGCCAKRLEDDKDAAPTALGAVTLDLLCFRGFYGNAAPTALDLWVGDGFYRDAAPTALDLFLAHGFYRDVAPTALDLCWMRRVLQRCRAYGARFVFGPRALQRCRAYGA